MRLPLDYICIKSGILCPRCQQLVESGKVSEDEIEVMKALVELEEQFRGLKDVVYHKSVKVNGLIIVIITPSPGLNRFTLNKIGRMLSEKLGAKVRFVEKTSDVKKLAVQLLYPVRVLGVNTLWLPDGSTHYIVRISKRDERSLPASKELIEQALSQLTSSTVKIRAE